MSVASNCAYALIWSVRQCDIILSGTPLVTRKLETRKLTTCNQSILPAAQSSSSLITFTLMTPRIRGARPSIFFAMSLASLS